MCSKCSQKQRAGSVEMLTQAISVVEIPHRDQALQRRRKLWELGPSRHCSVVGTCFSLDELRKLARKLQVREIEVLNDYGLHQRMVTIAGETQYGAKILHKALETKFSALIRRFSKVKTSNELWGVWRQAVAEGDVAGGYWALLTHPQISQNMEAEAFGEIHMMSHLCGASRHVDIQRLSHLETANDRLSLELREERIVLAKLRSTHGVELANLRQELDNALAQVRRAALREKVCQGSSEQELKDRVERLRNRIARESLRADLANKRLIELQDNHISLQASFEKASLRIEELENQMLRQAVPGPQEEICSQGQEVAACDLGGLCAGKGDLCGRCIAYIGGRSGHAPAYRDMVERRNGKFLHHDGGLEDGIERLKSILSKADVVVFPVTCVSHEAANHIKKHCQSQDKPFLPLRGQGIWAFEQTLAQLELNNVSAN